MRIESQGLDPQLVAVIVGGVIGFAGSLLILIVDRIFRYSGRIYVNMKAFNAQYDEAFSRMDFTLWLDFYNSSETPKSLREIMIEFKNRDAGYTTMSKLFIVSDTNSYTEFSSISISPKILAAHVLGFNIPSSGSHQKFDIYIVGKHPNGWKYKQLITRYAKS